MNELVIFTVVILLPGIIAILLIDALVPHKPWSPFVYTVYAIVLGVAVYVVEQLLLNGLELFFYFVWTCPTSGNLPDCLYKVPALPQLAAWSIAGNEPTINWVEILFGTLIAFPLGLLATFIINHKWINKFALARGISSKYGNEKLFSFYLNAKEILWVYVRDPAIGLTYFGRIHAFSETDEIQEVVLTDVTVFQYDDSAELYNVPYIYLAKPLGSFIIEAASNEPTRGEQ